VRSLVHRPLIQRVDTLRNRCIPDANEVQLLEDPDGVAYIPGKPAGVIHQDDIKGVLGRMKPFPIISGILGDRRPHLPKPHLGTRAFQGVASHGLWRTPGTSAVDLGWKQGSAIAGKAGVLCTTKRHYLSPVMSRTDPRPYHRKSRDAQMPPAPLNFFSLTSYLDMQ
jgi:hypothetical protein